MVETGKHGWHRTYPETSDDLMLWRNGLMVGRVHALVDGRWRWAGFCGNCGSGICEDSKRARQLVENQTDLATTLTSFLAGRRRPRRQAGRL